MVEHLPSMCEVLGSVLNSRPINQPTKQPTNKTSSKGMYQGHLSLYQWFSTFLRLWAFKTVLTLQWPSTIKSLLSLLSSCNFATVMNHKVNTWFTGYLIWDLCERVVWGGQTGWEPLLYTDPSRITWKTDRRSTDYLTLVFMVYMSSLIVGEQLSVAQAYCISFTCTPVSGIVGSYSGSLNSPEGARAPSSIMTVLIYIPSNNIHGLSLVIVFLSSW